MENISLALGVLIGTFIVAPILEHFKKRPENQGEKGSISGPFFHRKDAVSKKRKPIAHSEEIEWMREEKERGKGFVE